MSDAKSFLEDEVSVEEFLEREIDSPMHSAPDQELGTVGHEPEGDPETSADKHTMMVETVKEIKNEAMHGHKETEESYTEERMKKIHEGAKKLETMMKEGDKKY